MGGIKMLKRKGLKVFAAGTVTAIMLFSSALPVLADTGKVTADVLNLRSGKSLGSSIIGKIPQNTSLTILDDSDNSWFKVQYNGKTGYVSKDYVSLNGGSNIGMGVVNATSLNIRKSGTTSSARIGSLKNGTMINLISESNGWYYMSSGNIKGYVCGEYVDVKTIQGTVTADVLNVRSGGSLSSPKINSLKQNAKVEILSEEGDWYYVKSGSVKGYVFNEYIKLSGATASNASAVSSSSSNPVKGNIFKCNVNSLNVRKSPTTSSARVGALVKGNTVTFVEVASDPNWYKVTTSKGVTGYVYKDYVTYYSAGSTASRGETASTDKNSNTNSSSSSVADKIIATAKKYLGVKYVWGGSSPNGFDCSGFTQYVFKQHGYNLSRVSRSQATNGTAVSSKSNLKAGDLVFFSSSTGSSVIGHVGIYIGGGQFIPSSSGSKYCVIISSLSEPFYVKTYKAARRII